MNEENRALEVNIKDHGYTLSDELREKTIVKFEELGIYMRDLSAVDVSFSLNKENETETVVKAYIKAGGHTIEASETDENAETAMDAVQQKLKTQINREKGKELDRRDQRGQWDPARQK
jgi:ribosomal subunit interface protein